MDVQDIVNSTGFSKSLVYGWRGGNDDCPVSKTMPSALHVFTMAKLFNVSSDYLLGLSDERNGTSE